MSRLIDEIGDDFIVIDDDMNITDVVVSGEIYK